MGRVEIDRTNLHAHARNEGVDDTMLEGELAFDSNENGVAAVLALYTVGKKTPVTNALRDLVLRSLRTRSLVVKFDGEEIRSGLDHHGVPGMVTEPRRLPALKRLPKGGPTLLKDMPSILKDA